MLSKLVLVPFWKSALLTNHGKTCTLSIFLKYWTCSTNPHLPRVPFVQHSIHGISFAYPLMHTIFKLWADLQFPFKSFLNILLILIVYFPKARLRFRFNMSKIANTHLWTQICYYINKREWWGTKTSYLLKILCNVLLTNLF